MANRTYRYFKGKPDYPFGFGLSYSRFNYGVPLISTRNIRWNDSFEVKATVKNASAFEADEVIQMYVAAPIAGAPRLALVRFDRIHLKPFERRRVSFTMDANALGVVNSLGDTEIAPGDYKIFVGEAQSGNPNRTPSAIVTVLP